MEFDIQRFDEDESKEAPQENISTEAEKSELPEELNGLPEDIARETLAQWEELQKESEKEEQVEEVEKPSQPESVPYSQFKEKEAEAEKLKAQVAEYQRQQQLQAQRKVQSQQAQSQPLSLKITPEVARQIKQAVEKEAMRMTGFTKEEVSSLE